MKLAVMQPYFFPYIGYWQLIHAVDHFVIYDDVNYIKGGWVNRNRILINDKPSYITVPLHHSSPNKRICDTRLQPSMIWQVKLLKTIETTYRRAPCFPEVFPLIEKLIRHKADNLSVYLAHQLQAVAEFIGTPTKFTITSRGFGNDDLAGQARIIDICSREGATVYVNPQGGSALYDRATFERYRVELKYLTSLNTEYKQFGKTYVPWLSIIDVMMFNSLSQLRSLLNQYVLA